MTNGKSSLGGNKFPGHAALALEGNIWPGHWHLHGFKAQVTWRFGTESLPVPPWCNGSTSDSDSENRGSSP